MKPRFKKPPARGVVLLCTVAAIIAVWTVLDIGCVWNRLFGVQCPMCGMTRAAKMVMRGDFYGAFKMNPFVYWLPPIALSLLYDGKPFKSRTVNMFIPLFFAVGLIVRYIAVLLIHL